MCINMMINGHEENARPVPTISVTTAYPPMQRRIMLRTAASTSASLQHGSAPATYGEEDRKLTLS